MKQRIGFIILTCSFVILLLGALASNHLFLGVVLFGVLIVLMPLIVYLFKQPLTFCIDYTDILYAGAGVLVTFLLHKETYLNPVTASALVGVLGYFAKKDKAAAIYAGSFAGMMGLMFTLPEVVVVSLLMGLIYAFSTKAYAGFGGRLGTIGFSSTLLGGLLFGHIQVSGSALDAPLISGVIVFGLLGGVLTYAIQHHMNQHAVLASGAVGLAFGFILPLVFSAGYLFSVVVFQNSFIGMASKERLPSIYDALAASIIGSLLFVLLFPYFQGLGGKLGTTAMISVLIITQLKHKRFSFR